MWMDDAVGRTVVIGLGNPLMGDDGFGLAALERLQSRWIMPDDVLLMDGGTWGMNLLPVIENAKRVLFLDAVQHGAAPGTPVRLERDAIPRALTMKLSPHQVDLREVLAVAELRGTLPADTVAIGVQPGEVALGIGISAAAATGLDAAVDAAAGCLTTWGHACHRVGAAGDA